MLTRNIAMIAATAVLMAACGETTSDRALSGAAIGAGAGAVGGAAGGLTKKKDIDLGNPVWR